MHIPAPHLVIPLSLLSCSSLLAWARSARYLRRMRAERRRTERAQARLAQGLRSDALNLISAIRGASQLLMHDAFGPENLQAHSHASVIHEASDALTMMTNNVSVALAPPAEPNTCIFDVREALSQAVDSRRSKAAQKHLHFELHIEAGAPMQVEVDPQMLSELISNVIEHSLAVTSQGHVEVTLHAGGEQELQISVSDTGPSYATDADHRLFEPYGLSDGLRNGNPPATGLNLHVARRLARLLGGELRASSLTRAGTTYLVELPTTVHSICDQNPRQNNVISFTDNYARHRAQVAPKRILVAEDQESNAHVISSTLRRAGHSVVLARDAEDALGALSSSSTFDLVIADLRMPGTSGIDLMKLAQLQDQRRHALLPFIVLTSEASERVRQECIAAGAWAFLQKPMSAQALLDTIQHVCDRVEQLQHIPASHLADQACIAVDQSHRALLSGAISSDLLANFRDMLIYMRDMQETAERGDVDALRNYLRAMRGASHLAGATRVGQLCQKLLTTPSRLLISGWQEHSLSLDSRVDEARRAAASLASMSDHP